MQAPCAAAHPGRYRILAGTGIMVTTECIGDDVANAANLVQDYPTGKRNLAGYCSGRGGNGLRRWRVLLQALEDARAPEAGAAADIPDMAILFEIIGLHIVAGGEGAAGAVGVVVA